MLNMATDEDVYKRQVIGRSMVQNFRHTILLTTPV